MNTYFLYGIVHKGILFTADYFKKLKHISDIKFKCSARTSAFKKLI